MRRLIMLVAFALLVGSGAAVTASQSEPASTPEVGNAVTDESACATPSASPSASSGESTPVAADASELMATPEASPGVVGPCASPESGTPES